MRVSSDDQIGWIYAPSAGREVFFQGKKVLSPLRRSIHVVSTKSLVIRIFVVLGDTPTNSPSYVLIKFPSASNVPVEVSDADASRTPSCSDQRGRSGPP